MTKIISPRTEKAKQIEKVSQLTVEEFYRQWAGDSMPYTGSPATIYRKCMEFAEAYAVAYMNWYAEIHVANNARQSDLLRRAAELIRDAWQSCLAPGNEPENAGYYGNARTAALQMRNEWLKQRDQWLRDAGMEK